MEFKHAPRLAVGFLPLLTACYTEAPLTTPLPAPGTHIVALVTDSGVVAMSNALGPGAVEVEGVVATADAVSWRLQMVRVDYRGGTSTLWSRELVNFPPSTLANPTERRLDKGKSWLVAGVIAGTALLSARLLGAIGGSGASESQPPPPH